MSHNFFPLDVEPRKYRSFRREPKGNHGDVRILCKAGKDLAVAEVVKIDEGHQQAERLRKGASRSEMAVSTDLIGLGFRHSVPMMGYFLDFYNEQLRICIEIDGPHHKSRQKHDKMRDAALRARGIKTWRFRSDWALGDPTGLVSYIKKLLARQYQGS